MAIPQQKFREVVFQLLYILDLGDGDEKDVQALIMEELSVTKKVVREAREKVQKIIAKQNEIDKIISQTSQSYSFERIQTVERNILRLGVFEILFNGEIPPKVAIAEAVRLARKFSTPESALFINAILDSVYKASLGEKVDSKQIDKVVEKMIESEEKVNKSKG